MAKRVTPTKVIIAGASGKMGRTLISLALEDRALKLVGAFEMPGHACVGEDAGLLVGKKKTKVEVASSLEKIVKEAHAVIDFTAPASTVKNARVCAKYKLPLIIGTTGLSAAQKKEVGRLAKKTPIVMAPNMSLGVNLLFRLAFLVAASLGNEYDVEITETHHRHKKDAPSGTALELASRVAEGRKIDLKKFSIYGRRGMTGARKKGIIGIHALRGGDIVGDHTVAFMADGERIELTHKASSREAFARGALVASHFLRKKKPGLYNMRQVLAL